MVLSARPSHCCDAGGGVAWGGWGANGISGRKTFVVVGRGALLDASPPDIYVPMVFLKLALDVCLRTVSTAVSNIPGLLHVEAVVHVET